MSKLTDLILRVMVVGIDRDDREATRWVEIPEGHQFGRPSMGMNLHRNQSFGTARAGGRFDIPNTTYYSHS